MDHDLEIYRLTQEIERLTAEVERLRGILRKCMPGADAIVDLGDGETMCLYQQRTSNDTD